MDLVLVCELIFAAVFAVMIWTTMSHRSKSTKQVEVSGKQRMLDVGWTALSIAIFYALVWPALLAAGGR